MWYENNCPNHGSPEREFRGSTDRRNPPMADPAAVKTARTARPNPRAAFGKVNRAIPPESPGLLRQAECAAEFLRDAMPDLDLPKTGGTGSACGVREPRVR